MTDDHKDKPEPWEKKSERFEIRLPFSKKQAFVEACEAQGDTPSEALRRFIHTYLRRSEEDSLGPARRRLRYKARQNWVFGLSGVLAIGAMSIAGPQGCASIKAQKIESQRQALFAAYDKDGSGALERGEVTSNDKALHDVLDIDDSGGISLKEFLPKGRMQVALLGPDPKKDGSKPLDNRKLVMFDLNDRDKPVLSSWSVNDSNGAVTDKMDRIIYRDDVTNKVRVHFKDATVVYNDAGEFDSITFNIVPSSFDNA